MLHAKKAGIKLPSRLHSRQHEAPRRLSIGSPAPTLARVSTYREHMEQSCHSRFFARGSWDETPFCDEMEGERDCRMKNDGLSLEYGHPPSFFGRAKYLCLLLATIIVNLRTWLTFPLQQPRHYHLMLAYSFCSGVASRSSHLVGLFRAL